MGSSLRNSGWIVRDELGNELASYFGEYSDSSTTNSKQITISGGPYYLEGRNETFNSEPIYDYVIFEVVGSSPYISFYIPFLLGPYLSVPFKASYLNPVNFGNLEVLKNNNFDLIHFNTITENNCNKFIIQNSTDQINFTNIVEIKSKAKNGNSSFEINYEYKNTNIHIGNLYYRIKEIDLDGNFCYSATTTINRKTLENQFMVFPTPTKNYINMEFDDIKASSQEILIFNIHGIMVSKLYSGSPLKFLTISLTDISSGIYILQTKYDNGDVQTIRIVKE